MIDAALEEIPRLADEIRKAVDTGDATASAGPLTRSKRRSATSVMPP